MNNAKKIGLAAFGILMLTICPMLMTGCSSADAGTYSNVGFGNGDGFAVTYLDPTEGDYATLIIVFDEIPEEDIYLTTDGHTWAPISVSALSGNVLDIYFVRLSQGPHTLLVESGDYSDSAVIDVKAYVAVSSIAFDKNSLDLFIGDTSVLNCTITPSDATFQDTVWVSSNSDVATIDNGTVTAVSKGTATITAFCEDCYAECTVTVKEYVPVTGISLDTVTKEIEAGESFTLVATVTPGDATEKTVTWSSDNTSVATVKNGVVTAVSKGTAKITASCGGFSATCDVTVTKYVPVTGISLNVTEKGMLVGDELVLTATVSPADATDKTVTWSSDNTSVATVENGKVTAVSKGTAKITASCGGFSAVCDISVKDPAVIKGLSLNWNVRTMNTGDSFTLVASVIPYDATVEISWMSSDETLATVDNGTVTAISEGVVVIIASCDGFIDECIVTITDSKIIDEKTNPDGSITVKETDIETGSVTETTVKETKKDGTIIKEASATQKDASGVTISKTESKTEIKGDGSTTESLNDTRVSDDGKTTTSVDMSTERSVEGDIVKQNTNISVRNESNGVSTEASEVVADGKTVKECVTNLDAKTETKDGRTIAAIDTATVDSMIAQINAVKDSISDVPVEININVESDLKASDVKFSSDDIKKITDLKSPLSIESNVGKIVLDNAVLDKVSSEKGDVSISVENVDKDAKLSDKQKSVVGDNPVYEFSLSVGTTEMHELGGTVTVTIPYTLKDGQDASKITVWYLDDDGNLVKIDNAVYDKDSKTVTFSTTHFSKYVVGAEASSPASSGGDNTALIVIIIVIIVIVVCAGVGFYFFKKKKV